MWKRIFFALIFSLFSNHNRSYKSATNSKNKNKIYKGSSGFMPSSHTKGIKFINKLKCKKCAKIKRRNKLKIK